MTGFDAQAFLWDYRAGRRKPDHHGSLIALLPRPCDRLLDAGCGAGRLAVRLADHAQRVTGLDLSETMLKLAKTRCAAADLHSVTWERGNVYNLPFAASAFDCVVTTSVLHLIDLDHALPELKRVVRPGGRLLLWHWSSRAPGPLHTPYSYWFALRSAARALVTQGVGAAWQVARIPWRAQHGSSETAGVLTNAPISEACSRHLPGWQQAQAGGLLIVWDKPREVAE